MRRSGSVWGLMCLCIFIFGTGVAHGESTGSIVGWGSQVVVEQSALDSLVAVSGGGRHSLGLKSDGTIVAWGSNWAGQCDVPGPNADFVAVAGGDYHSLGLKSSSAPVVEGPGLGDLPVAAMLTILSVMPNPFNPFMEVSFDSRVSGHVTMEIYDVKREACENSASWACRARPAAGTMGRT